MPSSYDELTNEITSHAGRVLQRIDVNVENAREMAAKIREASKELSKEHMVPKKLLGATLHMIRNLESQRPGMRDKDAEVGELIREFYRAFDALIYGPRP